MFILHSVDTWAQHGVGLGSGNSPPCKSECGLLRTGHGRGSLINREWRRDPYGKHRRLCFILSRHEDIRDEFSTRRQRRQCQISFSKILPVVFAVTSAKMPSVSLSIMHYRSNDCGCSNPLIGQILCVQARSQEPGRPQCTSCRQKITFPTLRLACADSCS